MKRILSDAAGADIPSPRTFLEILSGNGPEYDSNNIDCYGELRSLDRAALMSGELQALPPLPGLLGADLEVLARQIRRGLGPNPTVSDQRQMFYMLANVHHQIATGEVLPSPERFLYYLLDLPFKIQNMAACF